MKIDVTYTERKMVIDCIYMAAKEGFYLCQCDYDTIEECLTEFLKKLECGDETIKDIMRGI